MLLRLGAREVVAALARLIELHGAPGHLRCDYGGKFLAGFLQESLALAGIELRFIEPGSPRQNGINESFPEECLNSEHLANFVAAPCVARAFQEEYNEIRRCAGIGRLHALKDTGDRSKSPILHGLFAHTRKLSHGWSR